MAAFPSTERMVPATSERAASVLSELNRLVTAVAPYMAVSRCLSTMNTVFVEVGSEPGSVPA